MKKIKLKIDCTVHKLSTARCALFGLTPAARAARLLPFLFDMPAATFVFGSRAAGSDPLRSHILHALRLRRFVFAARVAAARAASARAASASFSGRYRCCLFRFRFFCFTRSASAALSQRKRKSSSSSITYEAAGKRATKWHGISGRLVVPP